MNKVFKVIWNEAHNAYVVVSEIAKNRGSKSCSTKKLLAMLIATGVMTCASFDVLADEPSAAQTAQSQYVAFAPTTSSFPDEYEQTIDGHKYIYDVANQYWVREGYILVLEQNAKLHTPLSTNGRAADVAYTGGGDTSSILQSVTSLVSASGTVTNMGESLNSINASAYAGVSHSGGTKVAGTWNYIIEDSSWKDSVAPGNYKYGYVDLVDSKLPKGFKTAEDPNTELTWDDTKQCYTYKGNPVDYSNVYVIDGKIGVFTNKDGSKVYTGNVFGKNNEVLMTVKDANNKFYSYWASEVTDPSATMQSYRMADYEKDLSVLLENEKKLYRNDIKEVTLTKDENYATISLLRNGGKAVDGVINVTSGGGAGGKDTFVSISNGKVTQELATGSKVEAIGAPNATTGFKINGVDYTIKSGSGVEITQDATKKTTTITVDGNKTIITDTDTTYTAGAGIEINGDNAISVSKNLTGMQSIKGAGAGRISFDGANVKVNNTTFGENNVVVGVAGDGKSPVQINGESGEITGLNNTKVGYTDFAVNKGKAATEGQLKQVMDEGWKFTTDSGNKTTVKVGPDGTNDNAVTFKGDGTNIAVTNTGKDIKVELKKDLTVDSVKAGDFFMDKNKGVGYADKAYITSSGLNANNQKITGVADGTDDTDAVNVGQLKTVSEVANQGWKLSTNGDAASKVAPGEIVDFSGDKNISVSHNGTKVKVELNDELEDIKSISNGDSRINLNADSIIITNTNKTFAITNSGIGMSYVASDYSTKAIMLGENGTTISGGLDVAGSKITGVADGTIAAGSTDAVNGSQLNDVKNSINTDISNKTFGLADDNGTALKQTLDKTIKVKGADGITSTVKDGALEIGLKLQEGSNLVFDSNGLALNTALTGIQSITGAGAGSISFADGGNVKVNDVTIEKGGKITGVAAGTNDSDAVNVSQLNAVKAEASKKTTLSDGKNTIVTSVTTDGQTDYKVNVAGDLKDITSVSNGASKINLNADSISISNGNKSFAITNSGIGMSYIGADYTAKSIMLGENGTTISGGLNVAGSKITGVAAGTADTDAVNVGQLNAVKETANKGWKLKTNNGNVSDVKPGDEVEFDGDDNIKVSNTGNKVSFKLNNKLTGIESIAGVGGGSISFSGGNVTINNNVTFGSNGQIHNVTAGTASTDAVNVGQLNAAVQAGNTDTHIKPGEYGVGADNKVNMDVVDKTGTKINTVTITDVAKASDLGNVNNINNDLKNSNGTTTVVDAVNNLNQKLDNKVGDLQYSKVEKGDIADCDSTTTAIGKLDQKLNDVAATAAKQHTTVSGSGNIVVEDPTINADGGKNYNVKLADDINVNSVTANTFKADQTVMNKDGLKVGEKVSVTENAVTAGKTSISDDGVKVGDKTYISDKGLNANGQNITNVADGKVEKDSKDAINGGQLHQAKADINNRIDGVENQVISNSNRIGQLSSRVNKVGAGAAALAALHPMDFDPDDKLTFSAGYGNYAGQNAAAIGAYYRPDEKVMFSVGGTVGNGENMVNAGISFSLDRTNHVSNSRTALAREVIELRGQLAEMGAKMARMEKAFGMLDESKTKLFPDIPANHWAYEYIAELAGNGILEGYPDGSFGGDRLMTRYEFATMLYRAIENGAALEERIIKEFEPELGRIRVDRISGEDGDRNKIERVRVNATKGERDHYGNKLAK
jgi:hypothetical protein